MATANASPFTLLALDTDVFTDWRNQRPHTIEAIRNYQLRLKHPPRLTAMTVFEAHTGFESKEVKSGTLDQISQRDRTNMERLVSTCGVLEMGEKAAAIAAHIFARLSKSDCNKHWRDIFVAAIALSHGYGLATRNQSDFELIGQYLPDFAPILFLALWKA